MRTTVDIPEELLRRAKAQAALRGMKLKDFVTEAVRLMVEGRSSIGEEPERYLAQLAVEDGCVFPLIKGPGGPALRDLTAERVTQILEDEELERTEPPGRR